MVLLFGLYGNAEARRISRPDTFKLPWTEEQVTNISTTLEDIFAMQKGRYEMDIVSTTKTKPNDGEIWITTGIVAAVSLTGQIAEINYRANDTNFVLSPPVYGEIYGHDVDDDLTTVAQNVFYQIVSFNIVGESEHTVPSHTADDITIDVEGVYLASYSISLHGHQVHTYDIHLEKNNGTIDFAETAAHYTTATAGRIGSVSGMGILTLNKNDTVELWILRSSSGSNIVVTFDHLNLTLTRLGPK